MRTISIEGTQAYHVEYRERRKNAAMPWIKKIDLDNPFVDTETLRTGNIDGIESHKYIKSALVDPRIGNNMPDILLDNNGKEKH